MKLNHLLRKAVFRSRVDGFKEMLREVVYLNRTMIVIEKSILESRMVHCEDIRFLVVDQKNAREFKDRDCGPIVRHHCGRGARCVVAYQGDAILGYQFYTQDNSFPDLSRMGIAVGEHEAYLFDLFVFPAYRGTNVTHKIVSGAFSHLISEGIQKIYGFYYADNVRSLWWHRAILKAKEIKRIRAHRVFIVEWVDGRMAVNL